VDGVKHELVATKESLGSALLSGPGNPAPVSAQNGETAALLEAIRAENYDLKERLAVAQAAAMKSPQREVVVDGDGLVPEEDFNALQEEVFSLQAELEAAQEVADQSSEEVGTLTAINETLAEEKSALEVQIGKLSEHIELLGGRAHSSPLGAPPLLSTQTVIPYSPTSPQ